MTETSGYNGWKNYETWVTALWIDNDQDSYGFAREIVAEVFGSADIEYPRVEAADALKSWVDGAFVPDLAGSLAADLLGHAFQSVDWFEIVDAIRSELDEG